MSAIHDITEDWQREGLSPTWVKLQQAKAEHDALVEENKRLAQAVRWESDLCQQAIEARKSLEAERDELRISLAKKAELLRGCYAADHKRLKRLAELEAALSSLYESSKLVSVGQYDQESHDIAVSKAAAALKEDKT